MLFQRLCMNQRLRGIISALCLDEYLKKLADMFGQHFESTEKGTLMSDLHALGSSTQSSSEPKAPERLDRRTSELLDEYEKKRYEQAIKLSLRAETSGVHAFQQGVRLGIKHKRFGRGRITFSSFKHIR